MYSDDNCNDAVAVRWPFERIRLEVGDETSRFRTERRDSQKQASATPTQRRYS